MLSSNRPMLISAMLALSVALNCGVSRAQPPDQEGVHVTLSDLDLSKPGGVKLLYARINKAAERYCDSLYERTGSRIASGHEECVHDAVNTTVHSMNLPSLSALHAESGGPLKKS